MQFIPAITQSAEEFKTATDAYMELDLDDDDARDTEEYERYVHTAVVLASIVTAEIGMAAKRAAEPDTTLALNRQQIAKWLDDNGADSYLLDMGLGKLIDELAADARLAGHAEGHSCSCREATS